MAECPFWVAGTRIDCSSDSDGRRVVAIFVPRSGEVVQEVHEFLPYKGPVDARDLSAYNAMEWGQIGTPQSANPKAKPGEKDAPKSATEQGAHWRSGWPHRPKTERKKKEESNNKWARRRKTLEEFLSKMFPEWKDILRELLENLNLNVAERNGNTEPRGDGETSDSDPIESILHPTRKFNAYKYAIEYGAATEFNPSGIWVVEDFNNDVDEDCNHDVVEDFNYDGDEDFNNDVDEDCNHDVVEDFNYDVDEDCNNDVVEDFNYDVDEDFNNDGDEDFNNDGDEETY